MKKTFTTSTYLASAFMLLPFLGVSQELVPDDNIPGVMIANGFDIELGIDGLNYPSNITRGNGRIWVTEAGFPGIPPSVKEITLNGAMPGMATVILTPDMLPPGMLLPPFTDLTFHDGMIWISHRQVGANEWPLGAVSHFDPADPAATFETVIMNLPSAGDHSNNTVAFAPDGTGYITQGSATNSGVVGADNVPKWVVDAPGFRDMAPVDITFAPNGYTALVPTALDPDSNAVTAAYRPFDSGAETSEYVVEAATPANPQDGIIAGIGTVYSFDPMATDVAASLQLECWGLRNPFGIAFDASDPSRLFISNNGTDIRGQAGDPNDPLNPETFVIQGNRPVAKDKDDLFEITVGGDVEFFGWPDYFHDPVTNEPLSITDPMFCDSPVLNANSCPEPLFAESFANTLVVENAFATVGQFVSVTGFAPSTSTQFGYMNNLFVTESGSFAPQTGAFTFTGYKVSRFDHITGEKTDFVVNAGTTPEELFVPEKMNKPVSIMFMGDTMLIVDLGVLEPGLNIYESGTGKVWMVSRSSPVGINDFANNDQLSQLMPNPANTEAMVNLHMDAPSVVTLALLDKHGRVVKDLYNGNLGAGTHTHVINTSALAAGIYFVSSITDKGSSMRKLVVVH
ncbi:MAG: T9SS type A sorting domain-containing protein [Bacteroidota bacterium]|nr:T9SS type A sorting domain-containing protein [Bacteroidota bacterium]